MDKLCQLIDLGVTLWDDCRLGTRCDSTIQGEVARSVTHHFHEEQTLVAGSCVAQLIHRINDGVERSIVTDSLVSAVKVVVDCTRQAHDRHIELIGEELCARQ